MVGVLNAFMILLAAFVAGPAALFFIEILAALLHRQGNDASPAANTRGRIAVLVPAHNEGSGLLPTIADVKSQLHSDDRLLVIADNCSDDTAVTASSAGANVIQRDDLTKVGKGYALEFGISHLSADPPDVVIFIDADCRVATHAIDRLATICTRSARPVQGLDLMTAPNKSVVNYQVAEFAWRLKNWVRPLGLKTLGLPCQLMGTGMAFPWSLISMASLGSSEIVEDLRLGLDLASTGSPPIFCPSAVVTSQFPSSDEASTKQRQRWEHGHIRMILKAAPHFIWQALRRRNLALLMLVFDLAVPPATLLGLMTIIAVAFGAIAFSAGFSSLPLIISTCSLVAFLTGIFLSWFKYGRDVLPANALSALVYFGLGKLTLYRRMISRGVPSQWIRTDRGD